MEQGQATESGQATDPPVVAGRAVLSDQYDTEKLAPEYQRLLDPQQSLPADVGFYPSQPRWLKLIGAIVGTVVLLACGVLSFIGNAKVNEGTVNPSNTLITVGVFFLIASLALALFARAQFQQLRARFSGGTPRYGLFLISDAVLLRNSISYTMVPRERITNTTLVGFQAQVSYINNEGKDLQLTLSQPLGGLNGLQLLDVVRRWLGTNQG